MKRYDTIVIGGGSSGMAAALRCAEKNQKVLLMERCDRVGKKILVTGNGKCNLTNERQSMECYRSEGKACAKRILDAFDFNDTMDWFQKLGIYTRQKNGYVYPYNEQAAGVREAFCLALESRSNIDIKTETAACALSKTRRGFLVEAEERGKRISCACRSVIVATGGLAGIRLGCEGDGYRFAAAFGHSVKTPLPSLTALKSSAPFLKKVSGVRSQGKITLKIDHKKAAEETGELQWTDYGISGVAVFQVSRFAVRAIEEQKTVELLVDFMPEKKKGEVEDLLKNMAAFCGYKTSKEFLESLVAAKLAPVLLREAKLAPECLVSRWTAKEVRRLSCCLKAFSLRINGYAGYEKAQVTQGGISLGELTSRLESRLVPGLFFSGEVLDVDGICGGYNLQWAFSSGCVAGRAALERNRQETS